MSENEFRYTLTLSTAQGENGLGMWLTGHDHPLRRRGKGLPWGTEEFKAGAFGDFQWRTVYANRMHDPGAAISAGWATQLTIDDGAKSK